ncbi:MAG: hypothetical protein GEV07_09880 [Streptosporangiales bacterium]|nr:hypothetical protein [Streptosporangiales bacterium]
MTAAADRFDLVTFTSDFGIDDSYVAICKGVLRRFAPHADVVDVTHTVPAQDIRHAALVLARTVPWFTGAVHLAIVDPGVGTDRRAVAVRAGDSVLVGPDNGLLIAAADALGAPREAVALTNTDRFLMPVSATFHGRDVFAPSAGQLASGCALTDLGEPIDPATLVRLPTPRIATANGCLTAEIVDVDTYGNVQLATRLHHLEQVGLAGASEVKVTTNGAVTRALRTKSYGEVPPGTLVLYVDSAGALELAVNEGSAAHALGATVGDDVEIRGD